MLELLLAIVVTSFVGLALSTALTATARGMTGAGDARSALQRAHAAYVRLRAYTDPALCVFQHDPERGFVVWLDDSRYSGTVNLTEIRVFWVKPAEGVVTVERVDFPDEWPEEIVGPLDTVVPTGSDAFTAMLDQRALGNTTEEVLVDGAEQLELIFSTPDPLDAARFQARLTMDAGTEDAQPVLMALGMRAHQKPR
ncbi:MAG TPA: hypothetical protein DEB06_05940 [Phycisphaerales bacterium]|nr:hypothetical protein [Phycisphaerales bacterium]